MSGSRALGLWEQSAYTGPLTLARRSSQTSADEEWTNDQNVHPLRATSAPFHSSTCALDWPVYAPKGCQNPISNSSNIFAPNENKLGCTERERMRLPRAGKAAALEFRSFQGGSQAPGQIASLTITRSIMPFGLVAVICFVID